MKSRLLLFALLLMATAQAQLNIQFRSNIPYPGESLANIGGYVDQSGNEYALVGYTQGLDIVDVTDPDNPVIKFTVQGTQSNWREVKTYRQYAYVTTEGGSNGLQIVDLSNLPASINSKYWKGDGAINNQINTIHALHIDTATAFLYLFGSNISTGANNNGYPLFIDISDPWNPTYAGHFIIPNGDAYVHDGYIENDTMYAGHIYEGIFSVVDVSNKSNPVLLATQATPGNFTHNTWLNDDHTVLFTTDEVSNSVLAAYDITDLSNITEISRYQKSPGSNSIVHNTHIKEDFAVTSWYTQGVVITDVDRPDNPIEAGFYDTYPQSNGSGFSGCWGVFPFLPSGNLVCSDINNGLFVLTPTYQRGCYLEGTVTDSVSALPIAGATITILSTAISKNSNLSGIYKTGIITSGTYDIQISKPGYVTKIVQGVLLNNGIVTILDVQLVPLQSFVYSGSVIDSASGQPIANAQVEIMNTDFAYTATCDLNGNFTIPNFFAGSYEIIAGNWGHVTQCLNSSITQGSAPVVIALPQGYYDDFTFDFGWTVSGTSNNAWERGVPVATFNGSSPVNPAPDVQNDCGNKCFVTDNGTGNYWDHDVDNGNTILTSPLFDATIYASPGISYSRWFVNFGGQGNPNDTMKIIIDNGTTSVVLETITSATAGSGVWVNRNYNLAGVITPTSTMRLIVFIEDYPQGNITEGGLDRFKVNGVLTVNLPNENSFTKDQITVSESIFSSFCNLNFNSLNGLQKPILLITDLLGKQIQKIDLAENSTTIQVGSQWKAGIYYVRLISESKESATLKLIKTN